MMSKNCDIVKASPSLCTDAGSAWGVRDEILCVLDLLLSVCSSMHIIKIFSFEDPSVTYSQAARINPQNSRNLGFETGEPLLSVVVGVPSGDVALDRIDHSRPTPKCSYLGQML